MHLLSAIGLAYQLLCLAMLAAGARMAWQRGGREERSAAALLVVATVATWASNRHQYASPELAMMGVDGVLFAGLAVLALRSHHFWPLWAAAFQLVTLLVHVAMLGQGDAGGPGSASAYAIGLNFWSLPLLTAFLLGMRQAGSSVAADQAARHGIGYNIGGAA